VPRLIRFNPQGTLLATAAGSNVELWDVVSHKVLAVLPGVDPFTDLAFTPDGRTLAAGGGGRTASTSAWKVSDSAALVQLRSFEARPTSLAFAENGALAIGCATGDVRFYREGGNRCTASPSIQADPPSRSTDRERDRFRVALLFDAHGRLVDHDQRGLKVWQAGTPPRRALPTVKLPPAPGGPWGILSARSEDGRLIVLVRSSDVFLWRAAEPGRVQPVVPPPGTIAEESPLPLGPAASSPRRMTGPPDTKAEPFRRGGPPRFGPFGRTVFAIQAAPRADRLYMLGDSGRLIIWELDPGVTEGPIPARRVDLGDRLPEEYSGMALRPDGRLLALGDRSGAITLLDTGTLSRVAMIRPDRREAEGRLGAMSFSPDGRTLAVGSPQGQVFLWSLADPHAPRLRFRLPGQRGPLASLVFDPQGHRLASCALFESMVEIWDLELLGRELAAIGVGG
jgi:WD40 repeat protein